MSHKKRMLQLLHGGAVGGVRSHIIRAWIRLQEGDKMKKLMLKPIVLAFGMAGIVHSNAVVASGFALFEENASGAGNAFAGTAAVAEDASTTYFNPAGLTYLKGNQLVVAGHAI